MQNNFIENIIASRAGDRGSSVTIGHSNKQTDRQTNRDYYFIKINFQAIQRPFFSGFNHKKLVNEAGIINYR